MKLFTQISIPEFPFRVDHHSNILMMGSCFSENIGRIMERYLFPICVNPFGVTYNPLSVKKGLEALIQKEMYTAEDLDHRNDLWFSFDHYTGFSSTNQKETLERINHSFRKAQKMLHNAHFLIITWGTAWVYRYNATGSVVCNCHKIPASEFTRSRLTTDEIIKAYESFLPSLLEYNKNLKVLLTVSPVRHWKEGAHGNQLSKATLLLAQDALTTSYPDRLFYFPSYEVVMDELRDYRYYSQDMIHISPQATQYIWDKFDRALLSDESQTINNEVKSLLKMMDHRPLNQEIDALQKIERQKKDKFTILKNKYPFLAWSNLPEE